MEQPQPAVTTAALLAADLEEISTIAATGAALLPPVPHQYHTVVKQELSSAIQKPWTVLPQPAVEHVYYQNAFKGARIVAQQQLLIHKQHVHLGRMGVSIRLKEIIHWIADQKIRLIQQKTAQVPN